jgi:hypothetical protein
VKQQQRDAFVLAAALDQTNPNTENPTGRHFLEAMDNHSLVIATSQFEGLNFKERSLNLYLRDQYPKALGLRTRQVGKDYQYIEINFRSAEDLDEAIKKKFVLYAKTIRVDRTLEIDTTVIRVGISNIPLESEDYLKPRMIGLFKKYGTILEIGIHHVIDGGWSLEKDLPPWQLRRMEDIKNCHSNLKLGSGDQTEPGLY